MKTKVVKLCLAVLVSVMFSGCTVIFQTGRRSDVEKIEKLSKKVDELSEAMKLLEASLSQEIKDKQVRLKMMEKGLVITFVADILFDSGKAKIRAEALPILDKVSAVLQDSVPHLKVGIEGHTDNQPIKFSSWKSNWELSSARALSVLHYLAEDKNIVPERLSAIGYGEYQPVASNDTKDGRMLNRRVEIVIIPKFNKVKGSEEEPVAADEPTLQEPSENLK